MIGIEAVDEAIEEAPARAGAVEEQAIHLRRQPDHRQMLGQRRRPADERAVDLDEPPLTRGVGRLPGIAAGADLHAIVAAADRGGHAPGAAALAADHTVDLGQAGLTQAAAGHQEGDGLQQVGLAGAVRAGQHHRPAIDCQRAMAVVAEVRERQPAEPQRRLPGCDGRRRNSLLECERQGHGLPTPAWA